MKEKLTDRRRPDGVARSLTELTTDCQNAIFKKWRTGIIQVSAMVGWLLICGCQIDVVDTQHAVYFHKPHDYPQAIERLRQIHAEFGSATVLPPPRLFLIPQPDCDDDSHPHDSHDHQLAIEITNAADLAVDGQLIEIDIQRELQDIAAWLPSIAANSNLPKSDWDQINQHAKRLNQLLSEINRGPTDQFLQRYRTVGEEVEEILSRLEEFIDAYHRWQAKYPI